MTVLKNVSILILFATSVSLLEIVSVAAKEQKTSDTKTLTEQLLEMAAASASKTPTEKRKIMNDAINKLRQDHIADKALKVGDKMPGFILPGASKEIINSQDLLKKGPLVVVFYRGGWCPYCNLQLRDLQKHLSEIKNLGAELVAISPQNPDNSLATAQKANLNFYVLSDAENNLARKFGIAYKLPQDLEIVYKGFGIDLARSNSAKEWELPLSATYIVKKNSDIAYAFLDPDYKKRAETKDIIAELKKLK